MRWRLWSCLKPHAYTSFLPITPSFAPRPPLLTLNLNSASLLMKSSLDIIVLTTNVIIILIESINRSQMRIRDKAMGVPRIVPHHEPRPLLGMKIRRDDVDTLAREDAQASGLRLMIIGRSRSRCR